MSSHSYGNPALLMELVCSYSSYSVSVYVLSSYFWNELLKELVTTISYGIEKRGLNPRISSEF